ncbi:MAG: hypothetical protein REI12_09595 [Pedobacter sp.]|nr:hypothetical protein [Pedobacter sp.]
MTDALAGMDEGQRQSYLAALGIPLWSSRHDLPGALPSAGLEFVAWVGEGQFPDTVPADMSVENPVQPAVVAPPAIAPEKPAAIPPRAVAETPAQTAVREAAPAARPASAASDSYPRFACRVQLLAPGLLGVIALDDVPDLSAQEYRLLENLVLAAGGDIAADAGREHFRWPLSPNPSIPRDAGAAREALAAFLGRRREATRWLVLGETLAIYVRTALPQHKVIAAPALRELLENPAAKRSLWQALNG